MRKEVEKFLRDEMLKLKDDVRTKLMHLKTLQSRMDEIVKQVKATQGDIASKKVMVAGIEDSLKEAEGKGNNGGEQKTETEEKKDGD